MEEVLSFFNVISFFLDIQLIWLKRRRPNGINCCSRLTDARLARLDFGPRPDARKAGRDGRGIVKTYFRLGAILALCAFVAGCDPCGGPFKFNKFPGACSYDQTK